MRKEPWHRPSLVGPVLLITIGLVLLLANLGLLQVAWWELWRLWPLLLVLIGLDIIGRHSRWATALVAVLTLALVAGVLYVLVRQPEAARPLLGSGPGLVAYPVTQELEGAQEVEVDIHMGVGDLRVEALEDSALLLQGDLSYPQRWGAPARVTYSVSGGRGRLLVTSRTRSGWAIPFGGSASGDRWTLQLSPRVPLSLELEAGVSSSVLDLSRLRLVDLRIRGGVGRAEVRFPAEGEQITARVDGGVGEVILRIPESLAARITVRGGLGSLQVAERFERQGDVYETPGYATAANRLEVYVEGGVGSLRVQ